MFTSIQDSTPSADLELPKNTNKEVDLQVYKINKRYKVVVDCISWYSIFSQGLLCIAAAWNMKLTFLRSPFQLDFSIYICNCMCAYLYTCSDHFRVFVQMEANEQPWIPFLRSYQLCFLRPYLLLDWSSLSRLDWLAKEPQGSICAYLPSAGITNEYGHIKLFICGF